MADELNSSIASQSIFQTYLPTSVSQELNRAQGNKLVCKNNTELYFAVDNLVRCCNINPITKNYKLLETHGANFEIDSLVMNESSTFLAVVGETHINVVSLPTQLNTRSTLSVFIETSDYSIEIPSKIKKVLWQGVCANDCVLVVLNDQSEIFAFDVLKSTTIPQIHIKVENETKVNSIAIGSRSKISDAVKVYAVTDDKILAFNLYTAATKIAVSERAIVAATEDAESTISLITEEFGSDPSNSFLLRSALEQLEYYRHLQTQLKYNVREVRGVFSSEPYELFRVDLKPNLPISYKPTAVANIGGEDIVAFGDNEQVALFAVIKDDTISYLINVIGSGFVQCEAPAQASYHKPKKGFGFVDTFDETNAERLFWDSELNALDFLQSEKLPVKGSAPSFQSIPNCKDKFAVVIDSNLILVDCSWVTELVADLQSETANKSTSRIIRPSYNLLSSGSSAKEDELRGFALVNKFNQEVAIVVRDQLELIKLTTDAPVGQLQTPAQSLAKIQAAGKTIPPLTILSEPFEEIEANLTTLKASIPLNNPRPGASLEPTIENLEAVDRASHDASKIVSKYTVYAIKLHQRIQAQLKSLSLQAASLDQLSNTTPYDNDQRKKIEQLRQRQAELDLRMKIIRDKISDKVYQAQDPPLSNTELKYFEEINTCNKITQDLIAKLEDYKAQVAKAVNSKDEQVVEEKGHCETGETEDVQVERLQLENKAKSFHFRLKSQDGDIHEMMDKLRIVV
ncbi:uncharacterized protein LODBEIA_P52980 [Lodderomyces beijingensis]|uniref:Nucleoporin Nup82 n=1 Tax=Lodderomyces beijingensis TaxID=1775926 RepID=A0ABP0ZT53_9ASCO